MVYALDFAFVIMFLFQNFRLNVVFDNIDHPSIDLHVDPHCTIGNVKLMVSILQVL